MRQLFLCMGLLMAACGGAAVTTTDVSASADDAQQPAVKMRHQILFTSAKRQDVFDGYMLLLNDGFLVKAFAGPGVDLFTVARQGARHKETLHISGLSDRIDVAQVGADINRIYLVGCDGPPTSRERRCTASSGEQVVEVFDEFGDLINRTFPDAHGIGLTILFESYLTYGKRRLAKKITMKWGSSVNRMVILTTDIEKGGADSASVLNAVLAEP